MSGLLIVDVQSASINIGCNEFSIDQVVSKSRLFIAEKPGLARAIVPPYQALKKRNRALSGVAGGNRAVVSWCIGHLQDQVEPDPYDERYNRWTLDDRPIIPRQWRLKPCKSASKQLSAVRKHFTLKWDGIHCAPHWAIGRANGLRLADLTGADTQVVEDFAFIDDAERHNDYEDYGHGPETHYWPRLSTTNSSNCHPHN